MSLPSYTKLRKMQRADHIRVKRQDKRRNKLLFRKLTSRATWHDCRDGFICNANILEEHYGFASTAVKECGVYSIGHRTFVPYNGIWPGGNVAERLIEAQDCVVYRFYDTRWRQDVAFRLSRERMPKLHEMVTKYCQDKKRKKQNDEQNPSPR